MAGTITHEWDGTTLIITSDSGTSGVDLKGEKGDMGIRGAQGAKGEAYDGLSFYPIGAIYMSTTAASPAQYYGGTWERIKDRFLLAAGDTYQLGETGGAATVALTSNQIPSHSHNVIATLKTHNVYYDMVMTDGGENAIVLDGSTYYGKITIPKDRAGRLKATDEDNAQDRNAAHNNMPPYRAVYVWQRIA